MGRRSRSPYLWDTWYSCRSVSETASTTVRYVSEWRTSHSSITGSRPSPDTRSESPVFGREGWFALIFLCSIIILLHILFWEEDDGE